MRSTSRTIGYAFLLARASTKRRSLSVGLIVVTLAFGIGAFCATASALSILGADPLSGRGATLYHPQLDPAPLNVGRTFGEPPDDMNLIDARNVFNMAAGLPRVMTSQNWLPLMGQGEGGAIARMSITRATTRDFFGMFGATMQFGAPWSALQEAKRDRVIVLSAKANASIFGGVNSVGRELTVATKTMRVIGVLNPWNVLPKVYDLNDGAYNDTEEIFMPFETWLELPQDYGYGPMRCFGASDEESHNPLDDHCTWVQVWIGLSGAGVSMFHERLAAYSREQQHSGRYGRAPNIRLRNAPEWLAYKNVIPPGARAQFWVAVGLLVACLLTVSGLQAISFRARFPELGLRRAMGASRGAIVMQLTAESGLLGLFGGLLGIVAGFLGIRLLRLSPEKYADNLALDGTVVFVSLLLGIVAMVLSSLVPAIKAASASPYRQMQAGV